MSEHNRLPQVDAETAIELSDGLSTVLEDDRRRRLLSVLSSGKDRRTLDGLASEIGPAAPSLPAETGSDGRLELALHHWHLPKLEDCGLVEYDSDRHEARLTPKGAQCVEIFGRMRNA